MCENLVRIGWNRRCEFSGGTEAHYWGSYMWPAMPIFELGRAISVKSHVWKFGLDWLILSRVILSTNIHYKKKKITDAPENSILGKILFRQIKSKASQLWSAQKGLTIIESIWNHGNQPYLVAIAYGFNFIKVGGIWIFWGQKPPIRGGYIWLAMPIFKLGRAIPVKSHVWKFGLDWLKLEIC